MRTFAHDGNGVVFRAVVSCKWTNPDTGEVQIHTEYAGPYTREVDARGSATRITKWWRYRKDVVITKEIQCSALDWYTVQPVLPLEEAK